MKINRILIITSLNFIISVSGQCSICNTSLEGPQSIKPNLVIPESTILVEEAGESTITCADLDATLSLDNETDCGILIEEASQNYNISSYCCSDQSPPATCNFCTLENLIDPEFVAVVGDESSAKSCKYFAELAPFVINQDLCEEFQSHIPLCCSDFVPTCQICNNDVVESGGTVPNPEKIIPETLQSCELTNRYFGLIQDDKAACDAKREASSQNIDIVSYCGCSGQEAPGTCDFCTLENVIDPDFVVDEDDEIKTCKYLAEVAPFVTSKDMCEEFQYYIPLCCSDFVPSCGICDINNNNGTMANPEKIIPGSEKSCDLTDRYFGLIQDDKNACKNKRESSSQDIDFESYCGCPGQEAPGTCDFCTIDKLIDPFFVVDEDDETKTCQYLAEVAPFVKSESMCNDFQYYIPLCCSDFIPNCGICNITAGANITKPDVIVPGKDQTCELSNRHFGLIQDDETACDVKRNEYNIDMDVAAYCGCSGETPPGICEFCSMDELKDPDIVIGVGESARTCGYLSTIAPYISNQHLCEWLDFAAPRCCKTVETCSICEGGQMLHPGRIVEFSERTTCKQLDDKLRKLQDSICEQVIGDWEINLSAYCGCEGSVLLSSCKLCDEGQRLKNHLLPLPDRPIWTCKVGEETARFITSDEVCSAELHTEANLDFCCEPIPPTVSPRPTETYTRTPTQTPTKVPMISLARPTEKKQRSSDSDTFSLALLTSAFCIITCLLQA